MPNSQPDQDLTIGSIYRHLIRLAIPASMGMFFNTLYNLSDNWFAGKYQMKRWSVYLFRVLFFIYL